MHYKQLTQEERYQIYAFNKAGMKKSEIAQSLNRSASTIGREMERNRGLRGYRPAQAHRFATTRKREAYKHRKLTDEVKGWVMRLLRQDLSPEQVADYLFRQKKLSLHHETIYQLIYADRKQGGDLYKHLRIVAKPYRKRYGSYDNRGRIKNRKSIDSRPALVETRRRIGDWEGDTIIGRNRKSALLTLVERKTLYTFMIKLTSKRADLLADKLIQTLTPLRSQFKTITFDNGMEFAHHQRIAKAMKADIYFAHPYSSWERGINENTNGLIRQYFPKGTDFSTITEDQIRFVMERLNNRPRKTRGGKSPNELFLNQRVDLLAG